MRDLVLHELHLVNFKNYGQASLKFTGKINCFIGNNGLGKTNLLDAIHYLSACKSYFNPQDMQNIRHGEEFFVVEGKFSRFEVEEHLYCGLQRGQKKVFKRNKKEYDRLADHLGEFPLVLISPADRDLVSEGSEVRRRFVDSVIGQSNRAYLDDLIQYNRLLQQRNALLKYFASNRKFDPEQLEIFDLQMEDKAKRIYRARLDLMQSLAPLLQQHYASISGGVEQVSLEYLSQLESIDFIELMRQNLERDRVLQYTSSGVHKDDLNFLLGGFPIKRFGSQGQQKSFLIALKLAQFDFMQEQLGYKPMLLLDDIFDKLDEDRVSALVALVNDHHFGQIFITDTHQERTKAIVKQINELASIFTVSQKGEVHETAE